MTKKLLLIGGLTSLLSTTVLADEGQFFISGSMGANITTSQKIDKKYGKLKGSTGFAAFLGGGYQMNKNFRFGAEAFWTNPRYKKTEVQNLGNTSYKPNFFGILVNAYGVLPLSDSFDIFVGGGIGYARAGGKLKVGSDYSQTMKGNAFAFQVTTGVTYKMEDILDIDLQYRFIGFNGDKEKLGDKMRSNNIITIGIRKDL